MTTFEVSHSPGTPPHRHSRPVFGYTVGDEMIFELEQRRGLRAPR